MQPFLNLRRLVVAFGTLSLSVALAEDAFYHTTLDALKLSGAGLPSQFKTSGAAWEFVEALQPWAVLDGEGEAFVGGETFRPWGEPDYQHTILAVRAPRGKPVTGRLFVPGADLSGMLALKFSLDAASAKRDSRQEFFRAKADYYRALRQRNIAGTAWFRHQEAEAAKTYGAESAPQPNPSFRPHLPRPWVNNLDSTYDLFSLGRALGETLELNQIPPVADTNVPTVAISNLTGINLREMDWKSLLSDAKPLLDPLAAYIPFDQHAAFFPSLEAMRRSLDEASRNLAPLLEMLDTHCGNAACRKRYENQLCLDLDELCRSLDPKLVTSVALTGSDPYLPTGTDLALLCETPSRDTLRGLLQARLAAVLRDAPATKSVDGEIAGVAYTGVVSPDRVTSSYIASLGNLVLVSNSRAQLQRLIGVAQGQTPALASQDDYLYFRQKYSRNNAIETGFLVLSDAAIRRWCSPRWRIASSRRIRAAAALAEVQAVHMDQLVSAHAQLDRLATNLPELGDVFLTAGGVFSTQYGTLGFLTPIIELPCEQATQAEAAAYNRWREAHQRNWSGYLEPLAARLSIQPTNLTLEMSVMPLFPGPEFRQLIALSTGARLAPGAGDPHPEAVFHLALALNPQSAALRQGASFLRNLSPSLKVDPLAWLGNCLAVYADRDPFWTQLPAADSSPDFLKQNLLRLPVAFSCEVNNPLSLTLFLAAFRLFADRTAPGMTTWENLAYHGQLYVKVAFARALQPFAPTQPVPIYYAITPNSLVVTPSEPVLKRALDRAQAQGGHTDWASSNAPPAGGFLGTNLCLRLDGDLLPAIGALLRNRLQQTHQRLAWGNLPILNEWRRRYPALAPAQVQERFWPTDLLRPGGDDYVWDEQWQTMESTVYGHPAQPKPGQAPPRGPAGIIAAELGLTCENGGLSAKLVLERPGLP